MTSQPIGVLQVSLSPRVSDGSSVRLVMDYTELNSFGERPVHPFPSVNDIVHASSDEWRRRSDVVIEGLPWDWN